MDWKMKHITSSTRTSQRLRMPVWFMPVVFGIALLLAVVVALVMCVRWHRDQQRSNANEEEEGYEETYASDRRSKRQSKQDTDDYEVIPVVTKKTKRMKNTSKNTSKNTTDEEYYKALDSAQVKPQHEREYASLNKATCASKTSLSSVVSDCDVKEDRSINRTKRQGIVIPSLSNPRGEVTLRPCAAQAQKSGTIATKSIKEKCDKFLKAGSGTEIRRQMSNRVVLANQEIPGVSRKIAVYQEKSSLESKAGSIKYKPVTSPKPRGTCQRENKNIRKVQYENAMVFIDGDKTKVQRIVLKTPNNLITNK